MTTTTDWDAADRNAPQSRNQTASRPGFLLDVERAKGFAIILVVLGHIVARQPPADNEWYVALKTAIYTFHMPFFMYLGGLVFFHVGDALQPRPSYGAYLLRRAERLLVPFLALGLLVLFGKLAAQGLVHVDNRPADLWDGLRALFWNTEQSPATSVWYILVLFVYCAATPILLKLSKGRLWLPLLLAAALHLPTMPEIAYLNRIAYFYLYFMIGCLAAQYHKETMRLFDRALPLSAPVFFSSLLLATMQIEPDLMGEICALSSLPFLHGLMRTDRLEGSNALAWLGKYSFAIYLFNTLTIGVAKGALLKLAPWDGTNFLWFFPILLVSGLIGPVVLKKTLLDRSTILARLTR